ncbi:hypothetical protein [Microbacterium sp.]|uniref:hypothetical protein n=1 Tax=Microbacterium sp. TaxID=51671 RepID=UPI00289FD7F9|nr:hypothetical protein [Microbacterium sp.]
MFVHPYSLTVSGFSIMDGLPNVLKSHEEARILGDAVVAALHASNRAPLPDRDLRVDPPDREFLAWLGLRSYGQYMRKVRDVGVLAFFDDQIGEVELTPSRNEGSRGGFTPLSDERRTVMFESPDQLGRAVQEAMKKAIV